MRSFYNDDASIIFVASISICISISIPVCYICIAICPVYYFVRFPRLPVFYLAE